MSQSTSTVSFRNYASAQNYERYFVPTIGRAVAATVLDAAALRRGERVLDVACGTGIVARLAYDHVGNDGHVAGLDVNRSMLATAGSVAPQAIEWREASAESIPFVNASFDAVLSSLGLQFVPDVDSTVREMRRVTTPRGRVAVCTWGQIPTVFATLEQALARHVSPESASFIRRAYSLDEPDELMGLFADAGFRNVEVRRANVKPTLPSPSEFLWRYVHSTPLGSAVSQIDDDAQAAFESDVTAAWRSFTEADALVTEMEVLVTTASAGQL